MSAGQKDRGTEILVYPRSLRVNRRGFTLIEILVAALLLLIFIAILFVSLNTGEFSNSVSSAKSDLQAKVRLITERLVNDVRQTNLIEINSNNPSANHIKFRQVTGIDNTTGNYTLLSDYTGDNNYVEYIYDSALQQLRCTSAGDPASNVVFDNIMQSPFYSASGVPLAAGDILTSKKLVIVIAGRSQVRGTLDLNFSLTQEVKIRNE